MVWVNFILGVAFALTPQQVLKIYPTTSPAREAAIAHEFVSGNTPRAQFDLVQLDGMKVMPDYIAIGDETNFVRIPVTGYTAGWIAKYYNMKCPTSKAVDLIWKAATVKLKPQPQNWNYVAPTSGDQSFRFLQFQSIVGPYRGFTAGHKKDIVKALRKGYVSIYGWQNVNGSNIQPLFSGHGIWYSDYSHGLRLIQTDDPTLGGPCSLDDPPAEFLRKVGA